MTKVTRLAVAVLWHWLLEAGSWGACPSLADYVREPEGHLASDRRRGLMLATLDSLLGRAVGFALLVQAHLYPRTLFLQGEEDGAVPGRPAPRDRLGHLLLAQRAEAHRHARRARELHRQTDILSRQRQ